MDLSSALARVRVVLCRPSHPGNIGGTARAMKTMGLSQLYLVQPAAFPHPDATARASGAADVLDMATVCASLPEALQDVTLAAALTSRRRELALPMRWARDAAGELSQAAQTGEVALVFGNETYGLSNEELYHCQIPVMIPANPEYASLNLAAAVQILCYEMRQAMVEPGAAPAVTFAAATGAELEQLFEHFERSMIAAGFLDPASPRRLMPRLRRLFGRTRLEREEVNILRGMLSAMEKRF